MKKSGILTFILTCFCALGFTLGLNAVNAKADETLKTPIAVEEITDADFYMDKGASVRIADDYTETGIRFTLNIDKTTHDGLKANTDYSNVYFGIFVAPKSYDEVYSIKNETNLTTKYDWKLNGEDELVYGTEGRREIINLATSEMLAGDTQNVLTFNGSVVNMKTTNLLKEYVGVGYICYETNGETHYYFAGDNENSRSMVYVAQKAIEYGQDENGNLQKYYLTDAIKATPANYIVEYYLQNNEGAYVKDETLSETVNATEVYGLTIGDEVAMDLKNIDGYRYVYNAAEKTEGNVYANDKLVLKAYYNNESVTQDVFTFTYPGDISVVTVGEGDGCGTGHLSATNSVVANLYGSTNNTDTTYDITFPKINFGRYGSVGFTMTSNVGKGTTTVSIDETLIHTGFTKNVAVNVKTVTSGEKVLVFINDVFKAVLPDEVANGAEGLVLRVFRQGTGTNDALVFSSMTGSYYRNETLKEFTVSYTPSEITSTGIIVSTHSTGNIGLGGGKGNVVFPKIPFGAFESVSFDFYQHAQGTMVVNGETIAMTARQTPTFTIKDGAFYKDGGKVCDLDADVINGTSALSITVDATQVCLIYPFNYNTKDLAARVETESVDSWTYDNFSFSGVGVNSAEYNSETDNVELNLTGQNGWRVVTLPKVNYSVWSELQFTYNTDIAMSIYIGAEMDTGKIYGSVANTDAIVKISDGKLYVNDAEKYTLTEDELNGVSGIIFQIYRGDGWNSHKVTLTNPVYEKAAISLDGDTDVAISKVNFIDYQKVEYSYTCDFNGTIAIGGTTVEVTSGDVVKVFTVRSSDSVTLYVNGIKATVLADDIADGTNALTAAVTLKENLSAASITVSAITTIRNY